ncbi:CBO0543 family protein [Aquibacillus halophilus]|uniref:CBO0543 family protein n=1 Tax=Aquibacillus halophilus TaxID=930132 RepID=UPI003B838FB6
MYILVSVFYIIAGFIWGDWRNWRRYYPTFLFFMIGDLLYNFLLFNKPMWLLNDLILPNHTIISLLYMTTIYFATVLIYLGRFPNGWKQRFFWFLLWLIIYLATEYLNFRLGFIKFYNGWNIWWSALFSGMIFFILPTHHKRPLLAWVISTIFIITLLTIFNVNISDMK